MQCARKWQVKTTGGNELSYYCPI